METTLDIVESALTDMPTDIIRTIMDFLPDIRVLQISHALDGHVRAHSDYPLWRKCTIAGSVYSYGTVKMVGNRPDTWNIHTAAEHGNLELVKHLLRDNVGSTMSTAAVHDQVDIVKYLLGVRKKIFDHPQADSDIIMANAVSYGSLRVIEFMADSGATISSRLLENAITRRQFDAFKLLVNRGGIALIYPIVYQITDLDLVKFVVDTGVHVSYLMENARRSSRDVLEFLISQGAEEPEYLG